MKDLLGGKNRGTVAAGAKDSELKLLRESIEQLLPLVGLEERMGERLSAMESVTALRLTRVEATLSRLKNETAAFGKAARTGGRHNKGLGDVAQQVCASWSGLGLAGSTNGGAGSSGSPPHEEASSAPGLGETSALSTSVSRDPSGLLDRDMPNLASSRESFSFEASSGGGMGSEEGAVDGEGGAPDDVSRPFLRIRSLVEADRDIRSQLKELRSSIKQHADIGTRRPAYMRPPGLARATSSGGRRERRRAAAAAAAAEHSTDAPPLQAEVGCCVRFVRATTGPVLHPDGRFRSVWNTFMALLICFCGVAIPLEIAFEADMRIAMCNSLIESCPTHQMWTYANVFVDILFMFDIGVNCRTVGAATPRRACTSWARASTTCPPHPFPRALFHDRMPGEGFLGSLIARHATHACSRPHMVVAGLYEGGPLCQRRLQGAQALRPRLVRARCDWCLPAQLHSRPREHMRRRERAAPDVRHLSLEQDRAHVAHVQADQAHADAQAHTLPRVRPTLRSIRMHVAWA